MRRLIQIIILCFFMGLPLSCNYQDEGRRKDILKRQLGTYIIDFQKTNLGNYYIDRELYKNLQITFNKDLTFSFNMKVPFIFDSAGTWSPSKGAFEEWNWLYYKKNPKISTQFTEPWKLDSVFYMNSTTPQSGKENIKEIYFKKIKVTN